MRALAASGCTVRELPSQQWDPRTATVGGVRDYKTSYIAPASPTWSSILLHLDATVAERLAVELSRLAGCSMALFEYDQATWGYCLYEDGRLQDTFWSVPAVVDVATGDCRGNVEAVSRVFGVRPDIVAPYIHHVSDAEANTKAFEDDEFVLGDHWVRCDFMRRLGLTYPSPGRVGGGRHILVLESGGDGAPMLPTEPSATTRTRAKNKPWWKIW